MLLASGDPGRVVLLNGPPSSGKTALATALLPRLAAPWFHCSLDDFRGGCLERFWRHDDGALFERVMVGYVGALRAMALAGNDVIAEAVITPSRTALYAGAFDSLPLVLIGVRCELATAVEREHARTDRVRGPLDLPPEPFAAVHAGMEYDIEVDTTTSSPREIADLVASKLAVVAPRDGKRLRTRAG